MTDDLIAFLRSRLDEDKRDIAEAERDPGDETCYKREHRQVEAMRRIIDEHGLMFRVIGYLDDARDEQYDEIEVCATCVAKHSNYLTRADVPEGACLTVRLLASVYQDHPDYRQEWKP